MKKELKKFVMILLSIALVTGFTMTSCEADLDLGDLDLEGPQFGTTGQTFTNNVTGNHDGYAYELWKDSGTTSMTLRNGGNFECSWSNINNALFRKGRKWSSSNQTHSQLGNISVSYNATYNPNGNSYLCIYGWTRNPLVEYYILDSWGSWRPPGGSSKGTVTIDGGTYDIYETTRTNEPSIDGTRTFQQYWSVRTSKRTSGTISVTEHFKAWEARGMRLGGLYEVSLTVEGWQSSGNASITSHTLNVGGSGSSSSNNNTSNNNTTNNNNSGSTTNNNGNSTTTSTGATRIEAENMTKGGQYTGNISSPFNGVRLYANDDRVSFNQNFANNSHTFTLRGSSTNSTEAHVRLSIGGTNMGTFRFGSSVSNQTLTVTHNRGGQNNVAVELRFINDSNQDVNLDYLEISAASGSSTTNNNTSNNNTTNNNTTNNNTNNNTSNNNTSSGTGTTIQCENMTKGGQYTGNISSPFNGVRLYANDDRVSFNQNFANNSHTFVLRGASTNSTEAHVRLSIGGTNVGTFRFGSNVSEQSITVTHNRGGQNNVPIELRFINDSNQDVSLDYLIIR